MMPEPQGSEAGLAYAGQTSTTVSPTTAKKRHEPAMRKSEDATNNMRKQRNKSKDKSFNEFADDSMQRAVGTEITEVDIPLLDRMVQDYGFTDYRNFPRECHYGDIEELVRDVGGPEMSVRAFFVDGGVYTRLLYCKERAESR